MAEKNVLRGLNVTFLFLLLLNSFFIFTQFYCQTKQKKVYIETTCCLTLWIYCLSNFPVNLHLGMLFLYQSAVLLTGVYYRRTQPRTVPLSDYYQNPNQASIQLRLNLTAVGFDMNMTLHSPPPPPHPIHLISER